MIVTYKVRHDGDLTRELALAWKVAQFAVDFDGKKITTKDVKHLGLKSTISVDILFKYFKQKTIKKINRQPKLTFNGRRRVLRSGEVYIPSLSLSIPITYLPEFKKLNQIELDNEWAYISVTLPESKEYIPSTAIGVDRNTNGHCVVAACPTDGTVMKLGKSAKHTRNKYSSLQKTMQRKRRIVKTREAHIMRDMNHKISNKLVEDAIKRKATLVLEDLKGIRRRTKSKQFGRLLNSWSYFQLQQFIEYKAKLRGVPIAYIDPRYTSKQCSRCGLIGKRQDKSFQCLECGNVQHADVNAAFVIALRHLGVLDCPKTVIGARAIPETPKGIGL